MFNEPTVNSRRLMEFSVKRLSFEINVDLRDGHPLKMSGKISGYHLRFANRKAALLGKASCCAFSLKSFTRICF